MARARAPDFLALQETKLKNDDFPADYVPGLRLLRHLQRPSLPTTGWRSSRASRQRGHLCASAATTPTNRSACSARRSAGCVSGASTYRTARASTPTSSEYKLEWLAALRVLSRRGARAPSARLLVVGDFNIAPDDRDVYNPAAWEGHVLVHAGGASGARERSTSAARRIPTVRAARKDLQLVGLPRRCVSPQSGAADRPRVGLTRVKSTCTGCLDRQGTPRRATFGPRAGRRPDYRIPASTVSVDPAP